MTAEVGASQKPTISHCFVLPCRGPAPPISLRHAIQTQQAEQTFAEPFLTMNPCAPIRRTGARSAFLEVSGMYMTTEDMAEHLFSPIRRIRIEVGDPTIDHLSDDAWLNNELRRLTWRLEERCRGRRRSNR
jgi:hypothetical protein